MESRDILHCYCSDPTSSLFFFLAFCFCHLWVVGNRASWLKGFEYYKHSVSPFFKVSFSKAKCCSNEQWEKEQRNWKTIHLASYTHITAATAYLILLFNNLVFCLVIISTASHQTIPNISLFSVPPVLVLHPRMAQFIVPNLKAFWAKSLGLPAVVWRTGIQRNHFNAICLPKRDNMMCKHDFPVISY